MGSEGGCLHAFNWAGSWPPPSGAITSCAACGTFAQWRDGGWHAYQESSASISLAAWREVAQELAEALRRIEREAKSAYVRNIAEEALARFDALNTEEKQR